MRVRLSKEAVIDLDQLIPQGVALFGPKQATRYFNEVRGKIAALGDTIAFDRERPELGDGVRVKRHKAHVILYRVTESEFVILRVRHGREDWVSGD